MIRSAITEEQLRRMAAELKGNITKLDTVKETLNEYMEKYSEGEPNIVTYDASNENMGLESDFVKIEDFICMCISLTEWTIRYIAENKNNITDINNFG